MPEVVMSPESFQFDQESVGHTGFHGERDVVVVGAGQAGLAVTWCLGRAGVDVVALDAGPAVGHVWRSRWDSLRLFTPAEHDGLPGMRFPAPAGMYPRKDDVADYLARYVEVFDLPVRTSTRVTRLCRGSSGGFVLHTTRGRYAARQVVVATGPFQRPHIPSVAAGLAPDVVQRHSSTYCNPRDIPAGPVLVVGGGNSGLQIARELAVGHAVTVAEGTRPRALPQRLLGRDLFWWFARTGALTKPADSFLARRLRRGGDLVIGNSRRSLRADGVIFRPRVTAACGNRVYFADGRAEMPCSVIWATGFTHDFSWIDIPGVLDADGQVRHRRGISDVVGLAFVGLPWQDSRGSSLLGYVGHDAAWIADHVAASRAPAARGVRVIR
jgi:putative flavoprotein involved in K+ transport